MYTFHKTCRIILLRSIVIYVCVHFTPCIFYLHLKNLGVSSSGVATLLGTMLMGDADTGAGDTWELSAPSSQFCCEPKTALKLIKSF